MRSNALCTIARSVSSTERSPSRVFTYLASTRPSASMKADSPFTTWPSIGWEFLGRARAPGARRCRFTAPPASSSARGLAQQEAARQHRLVAELAALWLPRGPAGRCALRCAGRCRTPAQPRPPWRREIEDHLARRRPFLRLGVLATLHAGSPQHLPRATRGPEPLRPGPPPRPTHRCEPSSSTPPPSARAVSNTRGEIERSVCHLPGAVARYMLHGGGQRRKPVRVATCR